MMKCADILSRWAAPLFAAALLAGCLPASQSDVDEDKEPQFLEGKSRISALDYRGAIESFEKATQVNPRNGKAHYELGWLFDQQEKDPAAAIYHYERYLKLRPGAPNSETVKDRVVACKQELARTVSFGPVMISTEGELQQLREERARLLELLRVATNTPPSVQVVDAAAPAATGRPAAATPTRTPAPSARGTAKPAGSSSSAYPPASASNPRTEAPRIASATVRSARSHTVKPGESPAIIARKYGVKVDALLRANPGLDARKLKVGQTLNVP